MTSLRYRAGILEALRHLVFTYSGSLPAFIRPREQVVTYRYPEPVGVIQVLKRSNGGADAFIHSEVFEHNYYRLGLTSAPKTILDLGANIGLTMLYFSRCYPGSALAGVEPMPDNLRVLRRNLRLNDVKATVFPGAIDTNDGQLLMEVSSKDYGHKVLTSGCSSGAGHIEVTSFSIPTLVSMLGWERIGLLKVDIEGHEKVLLSQSATWIDSVDSICIECHDGFDQDDLADLARRFSFSPPERLPGVWLLRR